MHVDDASISETIGSDAGSLARAQCRKLEFAINEAACEIARVNTGKATQERFMRMAAATKHHFTRLYGAERGGALFLVCMNEAQRRYEAGDYRLSLAAILGKTLGIGFVLALAYLLYRIL